MTLYKVICVAALLTLLTPGKDHPHLTHLNQSCLRSAEEETH